MNCENFRELLTQDPARRDAQLDAHAEGCAPCAAFRKRVLQSEALIHEALRFDVKALSPESSGARPAGRRQFSWRTLGSGLAAGILVGGVVFWGVLGGRAELSPEALSIEVGEHWAHEPESWVVSDVGVTDALLTDVLDGEIELNLAALGSVTFAKSCWVGGEWIPHLVVQGEQGPYMVLLMPGRMLQSPVPVELQDEGLSGHILPAGPGVIAVLGGGQADELERMEANVVAAVNWTI